MARRLIVNADDFGLTPGINRAVAELYDAGAISSATLMASGPAFAEAVVLAKARPGLGVGCHVVLTDGLPISSPRTIPTLMARDGRRLRPGLVGFLAALLSNQIDPTDIERETVAQIRKLQNAGIPVTHVDAHKHTHIFPRVLKPLLRAAERTGVPAIRNGFEQPWAFPLSNGTAARTSQIRLVQPLERAFHRELRRSFQPMATTQGTVGVSATGNLDERTLRNLLHALPEGTWELVCHPGYQDAALDRIATRLRETREVERRALAAVIPEATGGTDFSGSSQPVAQLAPLELIHYGSLAL